MLAVDAELDARLGEFHDFAVAAEVARQLAVAEQQRQHFVAAEAVDDAGERAVVDDLAVVDDDHAAAERGHVFHVVAGQQDRDPADFLVVLQEFLDVVLGDDVEADRRLVEEQHFGRVEQGGR